MSMKKTTVGILTSIIVVSAGTASVFAAGQAKGRNFTDVDGNGICDNAKVVCSYGDEDQNEICNHNSADHFCRCENGKNFVDADGDRICDHCKSGQGKVLTNGKGMRHRHGYRAGRNK